MLFKVGLLQGICVVMMFGFSSQADDDLERNVAEKTYYYPYPTIPVGSESGIKMPYRWQNVEETRFVPLDKYGDKNIYSSQYNNEERQNKAAERTLTENVPVLTEYLLRRNPLTGRVYVVKVGKYRRDKSDSSGWKELWKQPESDKNTNIMHGTYFSGQVKPDMGYDGYSSNEHNVRKQPSDQYNKNYQTRHKYGEDMDQDTQKETDSINTNNQSVLLSKLFKKQVPFVGITSERGIQKQDTELKARQSEDQLRQYVHPGIYHRRATMCIAHGDPQKCKEALQLVMYLQSILDTRKALKHSKIQEIVTHMQQKINEYWTNRKTVENKYKKMLSQIIGESKGINRKTDYNSEELSQINNHLHNVLWKVLNFWNKIFGNENTRDDKDNNGNMYNASQVDNNSDAAEKLTEIWKGLSNGLLNTPMDTATEGVQLNATRSTETSTKLPDLISTLIDIVQYSMNDLFGNSPIKESGVSRSQDKNIIHKIFNLWKILLNGLYGNNTMNPNLDDSTINEDRQMLHHIKNTTENLLNVLMKQLDQHTIWNESKNIIPIDAFRDMWKAMWNEIFSYLSERQNTAGKMQPEETGVGNVKIDMWTNLWNGINNNGSLQGVPMKQDWQVIWKGKMNPELNVWKLIWNNLFKSIYHAEEDDNLRRPPSNSDTAVTRMPGNQEMLNRSLENNASANKQNLHTDSYETNDDNEENNTWENLFNKIFTSIGGINGTYIKTGNGYVSEQKIQQTNEEPLEYSNGDKDQRIQNTHESTWDNIFESVSQQFKKTEHEKLGSNEDNFWEDMMHEILYTENEIRNEDSKDKESDIWWNLKKYLNGTGDILQSNSNATANEENTRNTNDIWQYIVNGIFGMGTDVDEDMYDGHRKAWEYIQQWAENFTNQMSGQDEIWKYLFTGNTTDIDEKTESPISENYTSNSLPTTVMFDTNTSISQTVSHNMSSTPSFVHQNDSESKTFKSILSESATTIPI